MTSQRYPARLPAAARCDARGFVFGQRFVSTGNAAGGEFQANTSTFSFQVYAAIAIANDDFVVVWQDNGAQDGDVSGIFAQRYTLPPPVELDGLSAPGGLLLGVLLTLPMVWGARHRRLR